MKLCVSSFGKELNSKVDERFGRAAYFIFIDTETGEIEAKSNTSQSSGRGAGIGTAQIVSDKRVDALLTGVVGPNAFKALKASGIRIYEGASSSETVREALERFKKGGFKEALKPSGGPSMGRRYGRGQ